MLRKADLGDAEAIQHLINDFAKQDLMLPRSLNEIYDNLRDFWVYEDKGKVYGCCALHVVGWEGLAELKSFAVAKSHQREGIGRRLIKKAVSEAGMLGLKKIFVLTYCSNYFKTIGFKVIDKNKLPHKIWVECCNCPKFPDCGEVALIKELK